MSSMMMSSTTMLSLSEMSTLFRRVQLERRLLRCLRTRLSSFKQSKEETSVLESWEQCAEVCQSLCQKSFLVSVAFNVGVDIRDDDHTKLQWLTRALALCVQTTRAYRSQYEESGRVLCQIAIALCEVHIALGNLDLAAHLVGFVDDKRVEKWIVCVLVAPIMNFSLHAIAKQMARQDWCLGDLMRMLKAMEDANVDAMHPLLEVIEKKCREKDVPKIFLIKFALAVQKRDVDQAFQLLACVNQLLSCSEQDSFSTLFPDAKCLDAFLDACEFLVDCEMERNCVTARSLCEAIVFLCQILHKVERRDFFLIRQFLLILQTEQQSSEAGRMVLNLMRDHKVTDCEGKFAAVKLKVALCLNEIDEVRFLLDNLFRQPSDLTCLPKVFLIDVCGQLSDLSSGRISHDLLVSFVELLYTNLSSKKPKEDCLSDPQLTLISRVLARGYAHQLQVEETVESDEVAKKLARLTLEDDDKNNLEWLTSLCWNLAICVHSQVQRYYLINAVAEVAEKMRVLPLIIASRLVQIASAIQIIEESIVDTGDHDAILSSLASLFAKTRAALKANGTCDDTRRNRRLLFIYQMKASLLLLNRQKANVENCLDPDEVLNEIDVDDLLLQHLIIGVIEGFIENRGYYQKVQDVYLRAIYMAFKTFNSKAHKKNDYSFSSNDGADFGDAVAVNAILVLELLRQEDFNAIPEAVEALVALVSSKRKGIDDKSEEKISKASLALWNCGVVARLHKDMTKAAMMRELSERLNNVLAKPARK